jgi:hypothetical protein
MGGRSPMAGRDHMGELPARRSTLGLIQVTSAFAKGCIDPSIKARDAACAPPAHARRATPRDGPRLPFPVGCASEGPFVVLRSLARHQGLRVRALHPSPRMRNVIHGNSANRLQCRTLVLPDRLWMGNPLPGSSKTERKSERHRGHDLTGRCVRTCHHFRSSSFFHHSRVACLRAGGELKFTLLPGPIHVWCAFSFSG